MPKVSNKTAANKTVANTNVAPAAPVTPAAPQKPVNYVTGYTQVFGGSQSRHARVDYHESWDLAHGSMRYLDRLKQYFNTGIGTHVRYMRNNHLSVNQLNVRQRREYLNLVGFLNDIIAIMKEAERYGSIDPASLAHLEDHRTLSQPWFGLLTDKDKHNWVWGVEVPGQDTGRTGGYRFISKRIEGYGAIALTDTDCVWETRDGDFKLAPMEAFRLITTLDQDSRQDIPFGFNCVDGGLRSLPYDGRTGCKQDEVVTILGGAKQSFKQVRIGYPREMAEAFVAPALYGILGEEYLIFKPEGEVNARMFGSNTHLAGNIWLMRALAAAISVMTERRGGKRTLLTDEEAKAKLTAEHPVVANYGIDNLEQLFNPEESAKKIQAYMLRRAEEKRLKRQQEREARAKAREEARKNQGLPQRQEQQPQAAPAAPQGNRIRMVNDMNEPEEIRSQYQGGGRQPENYLSRGNGYAASNNFDADLGEIDEYGDL